MLCLGGEREEGDEHKKKACKEKVCSGNLGAGKPKKKNAKKKREGM